MRVFHRSERPFSRLKSQTTGELYSATQLVSEALGSSDLFIHRDVLDPGTRSSAPHSHTTIEEVVYVAQGTVVAVCGKSEVELEAGSFVLFPPGTDADHFVANRTEFPAETITFSRASSADQVRYLKE